MSAQASLLRINVGFIVHQSIGYHKDFSFDAAHLHLDPDLDLLDFSARTRISRNPQGLLTQTHCQATTPMECVRCLTKFELPVSASFTELFAFSAQTADESGLVLPANKILDLGPLVREYLILAIPIRPLCKPDCKGLCPVCGENQNETTCNHPPPDIDPRLDKLKSLLED